MGYVFQMTYIHLTILQILKQKCYSNILFETFLFIPGAVHGAPQGGSNPFTLWGFSYIGRKIEQYSYLCPGLFPWVNPGPATHESGMLAWNQSKIPNEY